MAVASTPNLGTGVLNVASIVSSLMTVEQQSLTKLDSKIGTVSSSISMLGTFLSKASALQTAITALTTASTAPATSSTNASLTTATATSGAVRGDLDVEVTSSARAQQTMWGGPNFTSASALVGAGSLRLETTDSALGLTVGQDLTTLADTTLSQLAAKINTQGQQTLLKSALFTNANSLVGVGSLVIGTKSIATDAGMTLTALAGTINNDASNQVTARVKQQDDGSFALQLTAKTADYSFTAPTTVGSTVATVATTRASVYGVTASVVKTGPSAYNLLLSASSTGAAQTFSATASDALLSGASKTTLASTDAALTVNGVAYKSGTNTFSNVLSGVTLKVHQSVGFTTSTSVDSLGASTVTTVASSVATGTSRVTVASQSSGATTAVQAVATAYNDLLAQYNSLTRSGVDAASRGPLNGDSALRTFMDKVRTFFNAGAYDYAGNRASWSRSGVTFQRDGTLAVDSTALTTALSGTLGTIMTNGLFMGSASSATDMKSFISSSALSSGLLGADSAGRKTELTSLNSRRSKLSAKLTAKQANYTKQYAALDAQLTAMQQTSTALASALAGLTASTSKN
jgi:flagellar hook-associated protein 2